MWVFVVVVVVFVLGSGKIMIVMGLIGVLW